MPSLFAICKQPDRPVAVKRVQISQPVQEIIGGIFQQQAADFLEGIEEDVPFGGDYKPDADEILTLEAPDEISLMRAAVANPIARETISAANFVDEYIKALFVSAGEADGAPILIQAFTAQQLLTRNRLALILQGDTFRQVTEPAFTLDSKLVAVVENERLKFKSFHLLKRIFALDDVYRVATDQQLETFCEHESLHVADLVAFKTHSDQIIRKLVHAVHTANVLTQTPVVDIQAKAESLGLVLTIEAGRIVMPTSRQQIKELLRFLDDSIYEGPLSSRRLIANSKRAFGAP